MKRIDQIRQMSSEELAKVLADISKNIIKMCFCALMVTSNILSIRGEVMIGLILIGAFLFVFHCLIINANRTHEWAEYYYERKKVEEWQSKF